MGDNLGPNGLPRGCRVFCFRSPSTLDSVGAEGPELAGLRDASISKAAGVGIFATSAGLAACSLVLTFAVVLDRRPYYPGKPNYIPIMIIAVAASLVLTRHLITLLVDI